MCCSDCENCLSHIVHFFCSSPAQHDGMLTAFREKQPSKRIVSDSPLKRICKVTNKQLKYIKPEMYNCLVELQVLMACITEGALHNLLYVDKKILMLFLHVICLDNFNNFNHFCYSLVCNYLHCSWHFLIQWKFSIVLWKKLT